MHCSGWPQRPYDIILWEQYLFFSITQEVFFCFSLHGWSGDRHVLDSSSNCFAFIVNYAGFCVYIYSVTLFLFSPSVLGLWLIRNLTAWHMNISIRAKTIKVQPKEKKKKIYTRATLENWKTWKAEGWWLTRPLWDTGPVIYSEVQGENNNKKTVW